MLLYHFHAKDQLDKPNLIVMDSHYSHTFNYCYINMMHSCDIKVISIKPHTLHLNQPLDKNPFASLKESFNAEMCKYNHKHSAKALAKEHFFEVFNSAWEKAMTKKNISAGFKHTGLWTPNRHALKSDQLGPSAVSDECELCVGIKNLKLCLAFSFRNLVQF